jgi:transient receptor potential cation channel subfamily M protein 2
MIMKLFYEKWNLYKPHLLISVTGGAQNFTISSKMKQAFKQGLLKVATSTEAWIVTGGTDTGCMKLVGEALSEELSDIPVIGIATWGKMAFRANLQHDDDTDEDVILKNA